MRCSLSSLLATGPLFAVAYFVRMGESSIYVFDLYSIVFVLIAVRYLSVHKIILSITACLVFCSVSLIGLIYTEMSGVGTDIIKYIAGSLRYSQMMVISYFCVTIAKNIEIPLKPYTTKLIVTAAIFPLVAGLVWLRINPQAVLEFDRFSSYFDNPNAVAAFICITIPVVNFSLTTLTPRVWALGAALVFYCSAGIALMYAGSNGGWVVSLVSLALSLVLLRVKRFNRSVAIGIALLSLSVLTIFLKDDTRNSDFSGMQRTAELVQTIELQGQISDLGSGRVREELEKEAWRLYISDPFIIFFGVGLGQSPIVIGKKFAGRVTAHNAFLVLLLETGLLGVGVLVLFFGNIIHTLRPRRTVLSLVLGYLLAMRTTPHLYLPYFWALVAFSLYISTALERRDRKQHVLKSNGDAYHSNNDPALIHYKT